MIENFEKKGIWWLPERPEHKVFGTLNFNVPGGISLDLFGQLAERDGDIFQPMIVLGGFPDGEAVTLLNCYQSHTRYSS